jgi:hypothetical protein
MTTTKRKIRSQTFPERKKDPAEVPVNHGSIQISRHQAELK